MADAKMDKINKRRAEQVEVYDGLADLTDMLGDRKANVAWEGRPMDSDTSGSGSWSWGIKNYADAVEAANWGFSEATEKMREYVTNETMKLDAVGIGGRAKPQNYYAGGSPNVARAIMGVPRDMRRYHRAPVKERTVHIVYCADFAGGVSSERALKAGAKVMAIVEALSRQNYSVKLSVGTYFKVNGGGYGGTEVTLKDYQSPLDMGKLSFPFAHSAWLRRIGFRWCETYPKFDSPSNYTSSYGPAQHDLIDDMKRWHRENGGRMITFYDIEDVEVADWMRSEGFIDDEAKVA